MKFHYSASPPKVTNWQTTLCGLLVHPAYIARFGGPLATCKKCKQIEAARIKAAEKAVQS